MEVFDNWLHSMRGLCLVTGPTGAGKTTTLYALLQELDVAHRAVVTLEDPVEYQIDGITQIEIDEDHGLDFQKGMKSMLRLDPDYMLVGEVRDRTSLATTIEASASGHIVMSTVHSPDTPGVVSLLRTWQIPDARIATVLDLVVNQRLVRKLCSYCKEETKLTPGQRSWLKKHGITPPAKAFESVGCKKCFETGYHGRVGIFEIWQKEQSDYDLLLHHVSEIELRQHLEDRGMKSLLHDGVDKVREGITSLTEIQRMGAFTMPGEIRPSTTIPQKRKTTPKRKTPRKKSK